MIDAFQMRFSSPPPKKHEYDKFMWNSRGETSSVEWSELKKYNTPPPPSLSAPFSLPLISDEGGSKVPFKHIPIKKSFRPRGGWAEPHFFLVFYFSFFAFRVCIFFFWSGRKKAILSIRICRGSGFGGGEK